LKRNVKGGKFGFTQEIVPRFERKRPDAARPE
jgi:hypothetical protein